MRLAAPFVGRLDELQLIADALESPHCRCCVIAGATAVGKTRLAREAAAAARAAGWSSWEATATASAACIPLGALAHLLPSAREEVAPGPEMISRAREHLARLAPGGRCILAVDDAHLLDAVSATLLAQLAATTTLFPLLVVAAGAPLPDALLRVWQDDATLQVDLPTLDGKERRDVLTGLLGGEADEATHVAVIDSVGDDLVLHRELVAATLASGRWENRDGHWHWDGSIVVTPRLEAIVRGRVERLDGVGRGVLELVSVAGSLGLSLLGRLTRQESSRDDTAAPMLATQRDGRRTELRVAPRLIGEVVRATMDPLRRQAVLRDLAAALAATGARRAGDPARLAEWRLDAGIDADAAALAGAARAAVSTGDYRLAERLARASLAGEGGVTASVALAEALIGLDAYGLAETELARADSGSRTDADRALVSLVRAHNLAANLHDPTAADALLQARNIAIREHATEAERQAVESSIHLAQGRPRDALALARSILGTDEAPAQARAHAHLIVSTVLPSSGRPAEALNLEPLVPRTPSVAARSPLGLRESYARSLTWDALWFAGRLEEAEVLAWEAYRRAVATGALPAKAVACFELGLCSRARGRVRTAVQQLGEAATLAETQRPLWHRMVLVAVAQTAVMAGDVELARSSLDRASERRGTPSPFEAPRIELCRAWLEAMTDRPSAARDRAMTAADLAAAHGLHAIEALILHDAARLGDPSVVATRLRLVTERTEGDLFPVYADQVTFAARRDAAGLDEVSRRLEEMGYRLDAAEASVQAWVIHRASRRPALARAARDRAVRLLETCEGAVTPPLGPLDAQDAGSAGNELTPRERETAELAASGLSNREIASLLGLSKRTVDNLLHRTFEKLDIRRRTDLETAVGADARRARALSSGEVGRFGRTPRR